MAAKVTLTMRDWLDGICAWPVTVYRLLKYGYSFRRIYLGEGKWTILDQDDYYHLRDFKWIVYGSGNNLYAVRHKFVGPNKTWQISMHREIMQPKDRRFVDHKNCDSLDNRKSNLRFATRAQNNCNRRKRKNATSQYLGVYFCRQRGKWESRIMYRRKRIHLGRYKNEIEAAKAYDEAAKKYYGQFAKLNFPPQDERSRALFTRVGRGLEGLVRKAEGR